MVITVGVVSYVAAAAGVASSVLAAFVLGPSLDAARAARETAGCCGVELYDSAVRDAEIGMWAAVVVSTALNIAVAGLGVGFQSGRVRSRWLTWIIFASFVCCGLCWCGGGPARIDSGDGGPIYSFFPDWYSWCQAGLGSLQVLGLLTIAVLLARSDLNRSFPTVRPPLAQWSEHPPVR
jgi:hypothetical protein